MTPFFILGAPRSGTTMLRDIFKQVDELYSPEETHFFRWAAPYKGVEFMQFYRNNPVLKKHREMDGVDDDTFFDLVNQCKSKAEFTKLYCELVAEKKGARAWFEKTPQNVYGLPLIIDQFPDAKIIHLVRHPLSVIKSLMAGKVMRPQEFTGAMNYWMEAVAIVNVLKPVMGDRLTELRYEDLQENPRDQLIKVFSGLGYSGVNQLSLGHVKAEVKIPSVEFSEDNLEQVEQHLGKYMNVYGYSLKSF